MNSTSIQKDWLRKIERDCRAVNHAGTPVRWVDLLEASGYAASDDALASFIRARAGQNPVPSASRLRARDARELFFPTRRDQDY